MIHAYLSQPEYQQEILYELPGAQVFDQHLVLSSALCPQFSVPAFAEDIWSNCEIIAFHSISDAIKKLKTKSLRWFYYKSKYVRRGALITEGLKLVKDNAKPFAIFTLYSDNELLICQNPWKKWPCGKPYFFENKSIPPNRAYLKLWEALDFLGTRPKAEELCLDLGASPGGWTWVLASSGAQVIAVDKAPLDPKITAMPNVRFQEGSAFALEPYPVDYLCSDIICYPERALALIQKWLPFAKHIICTIKLQGETDWQVIKELQAIPNSLLTHLFHNKHELTFCYPFNMLKS